MSWVIKNIINCKQNKAHYSLYAEQYLSHSWTKHSLWLPYNFGKLEYYGRKYICDKCDFNINIYFHKNYKGKIYDPYITVFLAANIKRGSDMSCEALLMQKVLNQ